MVYSQSDENKSIPTPGIGGGGGGPPGRPGIGGGGGTAPKYPGIGGGGGTPPPSPGNGGGGGRASTLPGGGAAVEGGGGGGSSVVEIIGGNNCSPLLWLGDEETWTHTLKEYPKRVSFIATLEFLNLQLLSHNPSITQLFSKRKNSSVEPTYSFH